MIGRLNGVVDAYGEDHLVLDVNGVGYVVHCSGRTLQAMPPAGEPASVVVETHVREDMIRLYGFRSDAERDWFRLLQNVQGVGAKAALAILSVLDVSGVAQAVAMGDKAQVSRAPGVGPKLAQRVVSELKDKAPPFVGGSAFEAGISGEAPDAAPAARDAVSALVNLGYPQGQASAAIATAIRNLGDAGDEADAKTLIRHGLREIAR